MSTRLAVVVAFACCAVGVARAQELGEDLGQLSANPHQPNATSSPIGPTGHPHSSTGANNPGSRYGSLHSNQSATNPYATEAPRLYDSNGNYHGRLSANRYDPDSISNPYGRYGNKFSPDSVNNRYGAMNPYEVDSPGNPYGKGLRIEPGDTATTTTPPRNVLDAPAQKGPSEADTTSQQLESEPLPESSDSAPTDGDSAASEAAE